MRKPNFPLAFFLAAIAGGLAAFVASMVIIMMIGEEPEDTIKEAFRAAGFIAFYAAVISAAYVLVIGFAVVIYVRFAHRVPSLATALLVGVVTGVLPFVAPAVLEYLRRSTPTMMDLVLIPTLAIASSLATAWTFWRVGLRGRTVT